MKLTFDPSANVVYLCVKEKVGEVETLELTSDVLVDVDETGAVFGIELLDAGRLAGDGRKLVVENVVSGGRTELDLA